MKLSECPVRPALQVIGGKWKPVILYHLMRGKKRFGELRALLPEATQKMLTQHLRELESDKIIVRRIYSEVPPKVEYSLTPFGKTLRPVMRELCQWGKSLGKAPASQRSPATPQNTRPDPERHSQAPSSKQCKE